jgi:proteasome lid subunit RPN8/RPN11
MKVLVSPSEIKKFKRRVLKKFPNEHMELLWGKKIGKDEYQVFLFDRIPHLGTPRTVYYDSDEFEVSRQSAEANGYVLLGSIHSHPLCQDAAPSEQDYDDSLEHGEMISGIALVEVNKNKRKKVTIRFWGPLQQVEPVYF